VRVTDGGQGRYRKGRGKDSIARTEGGWLVGDNNYREIRVGERKNHVSDSWDGGSHRPTITNRESSPPYLTRRVQIARIG